MKKTENRKIRLGEITVDSFITNLDRKEKNTIHGQGINAATVIITPILTTGITPASLPGSCTTCPFLGDEKL